MIGTDAWPLFLVVLALVIVQRLLELRLAERNRRRLLARGAVEHGGAHYPLVVGAHVLFYFAWTTETAFRRPTIEAQTVVALALFVAAQIGRAWVIVSLGDRWTTRILVLPGAALVTTGPYRYLRHPNYAIVVTELVALAVAFTAWWSLVLAIVSQSVVLSIRIRAEDAALRPTR